MATLSLPAYGWLPRPHQDALWRYLQGGGKRSMAIWHRRAGKDEVALHHTAISMMQRPGNYWHCLPQYSQGRKAIWTAVNAHSGRRRIDEAFPEEIRESSNDHEMFLRLRNGSTWSVIGSDRYDTTVGTSVAGIVYSEWALANPSAWGYHRPILEENQGWACFITTPRGNNHAKAMFDHAQKNPQTWFSERLPVTETGMLSETALAETLAEMQSLYGEDHGRAAFEQEYLCSWNSSLLGSFYGLETGRVRDEERILDIEHDDAMPVQTAWDLGVRDDTSIWWWQRRGQQIYILDFYSASGVGLEHYVDVLAERERLRGWKTGTCWVPHDANVREFGSGRTRIETMWSLGLRPQMVPNVSLLDGINAARVTLPYCLFHPRTEDKGFVALEQYRREWNDETKAFRAAPVHDWTSHPSDAFRYLSLAWRNVVAARGTDKVKIQASRGLRIPPIDQRPRFTPLQIGR